MRQHSRFRGLPDRKHLIPLIKMAGEYCLISSHLTRLMFKAMKKRAHAKWVFLMKVSFVQLIIILSLVTLAQAARVNGQELLEKRISVQIRNSNLRDALGQVEKAANVKFVYYSQLLAEKESITLKASEERLGVVLDKLLTPHQIKFEVEGNQIVLTKRTLLEETGQVLPAIDERDRQVSGLVRDESDMGLPGVNVVVKGTTTGTTTDVEGRFTLAIDSDDVVLVFSFIGYKTQEILVADKQEINVVMAMDVATLGEVVVVGYGTQKKSDIISSVSSVDPKSLTVRATPNFESGLQGLAAGVSVQSQSGSPGAPVRVLIRGTNSINLTTDPLYIVDGMPINVGAAGVGSSNISPMSLINQNDIETIEILKDAAATAIYGSRGSNGVIIITTKSGKKGEGTVNVNYSTGVSQLTRSPEDVGYANTRQWFTALDEAYINESGSPVSDNLAEYYTRVPRATIPLASPQLTRQQAEQINTDWYDELFGTGTYHDLNVSTSKGTENTSFYISGNYRRDKGVQKNNDLDRVTVRTNLDFNPTRTLTINSKMTFGYTSNDQRSSGVTSIAVDALPWFPVYEIENPERYYNAYTGSNPVAVSDTKNYLNRVQQYRGLGGLSLTYRPLSIEGLAIRTELSGDILQSNRVEWTGGDIRPDPTNTRPEAAASEEAITFTGINYNLYGNYDKSFGQHTISVVAGAEATRSYQYIRYMYGTGLIGKYQEIGTPGNLITMRGQMEYERYLMGYFGRANYKLNERYLLGVSLRRDGSSVFTPENRWGTFVAVSAGWILTEENFMSFLGDNTFLKLRGSYGETGNQSIPPNLDMIQYNLNPVVYGSTQIGGVNGTVPVNIAVTNLKWETTRSSDIGLDFGFFNNRLNGSVAYYHRLVDGMLLQAPLPYSTGVSSSLDLLIGQGSYASTSSIWGNFGDMTNSGLEIELFSTNVEKGNFRWATSLNLAFNRNEIRRLTESVDETGGGFINGYGNTISRKGDRRAVWFIADYAGVNPETGRPMIYQVDAETYATTGETVRRKNNVGEDIIIEATNQNIRNNRFYQDGKSGDPKYQGGITNTFQYKSFDFSFLFAFSGGNYILDYDRQQSTVINPTRNLLREVYDNAWRESGDVAKYPRLLPQLSDYSWAESYHNGFLYKGDFIRLRNIQAGYTLSKATAERLGLKSARVFVLATNPLTFTNYPGYDPEGTGTASVPGFIYYANAIPQLKSLTLGLDIKF